MFEKAKFEEIQLGETYYVEIHYTNGEKTYIPVKIIDKTEKYVSYQYEDNWKEYINKSQWTEIYLYKQSKQLTLF